MTGAERRNHPGNLRGLPARSPLSRSPSPTSRQHNSSSNSHQLNNRSNLAQRQAHYDASSSTANFDFGATPNYEVPPDSLFNGVAAQGSSSASYWLPDSSQHHSVPPHIAAESSNLHNSNPRRSVPHIDTTGRPHSRAQSLIDQSEKRPTSPHITSATPTSARHHHPFSAQPSATSRSGSLHESDSNGVRQNKAAAPHRVASPLLLNSGIGRAAVSAAQSIMDAMAGRASPANVRKQSLHQDRHSSSDDEAGKGHGRNVARFTPSAYRPTSAMDRVESPQATTGDAGWRASISEVFVAQRATPAAYRPGPKSPPRRRGSAHVDQQISGEDSTDIQVSDGKTHSSITIGSPIVVPQARRGAVRLRPARKRRVARQIKPRRTLKQNILVCIATVSHFIRLLANPAEALRRFREYCIDTRIAIDDSFRDPQTGMRSYYPPWLQAYVPLLIWLGISLTSTALVITFHTKVFIGLDHLSAYLQGLGLWGKVMLGSLIFLTTFPPLPLYSTLIMLCGYAFGLWQGFVISYIAALSGAIVVFVLSRSLLREWMVGLLNKSGGLKKVVRAIEKQPKLLFLVRLAPYPYNLMNTLLASSPTLTMRTYVTCTALALPKLLIHTGLGTSIKNFAAYNGAGGKDVSPEEAEASKTAENVKKWAGLVGIGLCVGIMIYLLSVARRAVDELDDEDDGSQDELYDYEDEELLSSDDEDQDGDEGGRYRGAGVDMRERAGPSTLGFRNGYAPITTSPEERFRQSMRQPQPVPLALERGSASGSFDGKVSLSGSGSVGHQSIDLADKIAEMEAHAESMTFESPLHNGGGEGEERMVASPAWSPMVEQLEASVDTQDTIKKEPPFFLDHQDEAEVGH